MKRETYFCLVLMFGACAAGGWFASKLYRLEPNPNFVNQPHSATPLDLVLITAFVLAFVMFGLWWWRYSR